MAGMMVMARKNELKMAMMTVIAIAPTNSPAGPGINAIGANANAVVSVDPNNGRNKCLTLVETATGGEIPWRSFVDSLVDNHDRVINQQA